MWQEVAEVHPALLEALCLFLEKWQLKLRPLGLQPAELRLERLLVPHINDMSLGLLPDELAQQAD